MKITREMVEELNNELANCECPFRYKYDDCAPTGNPCMKITLPSMNGVNSFVINPTVVFFEWLKGWFEAKGIELDGNNDRSSLWSKNGWDEPGK